MKTAIVGSRCATAADYGLIGENLPPGTTEIISGGAQGVDGVKYLAACGGAVVLIVFILQVAAAIKVFFLDPETKKDIVDSVDQIEQ